MLSSMFSKSRTEDKKYLLELIELIEMLVRIKTPQALDLAESLGGEYMELEEKVNTFDYSEQDKFYENYFRN